jgi:siroheme synthase-like protein
MAASRSDGYPVVLRMAGRRVLVVGAGKVAARKIGPLVAAGAVVTVVAPAIHDDVARLDGIDVVHRRYAAADLEGMQFVIVSTDDAAAQQQVFDDCEARGIWCNAADDPDRCSVILPAVARRGPVLIAVSTQGTSPALAGVLRDIVADAVPANVEQVADVLGERRRQMKSVGQSTESIDWRPIVRSMLASPIGDQATRVDKSDTSSVPALREAHDVQDQS